MQLAGFVRVGFTAAQPSSTSSIFLSSLLCSTTRAAGFKTASSSVSVPFLRRVAVTATSSRPQHTSSCTPSLVASGISSRFYSLLSSSSCPASSSSRRRPQAASREARPVNLLFLRACSHEALQSRSATASYPANMADRDILPDYFKPAHYDLVIKDLDFKNWSYTGTVV